MKTIFISDGFTSCSKLFAAQQFETSALAKLSTFLGTAEFSTADPMQLICSSESESQNEEVQLQLWESFHEL